MPRRTELVSSLHNSGRQFVVVTTGGGSGVIGEWLSVPGGSRSLLEAVVPYCSSAMNEWLGRTPESYCSQETALMMASVAWRRAVHLGASTTSAIGLAGTASLVSDRPKKGPHRGWIAAQSATETRLYSLELTKGARDRAKEERVLSDLLLMAAAESVGHSTSLLPTLVGDESIEASVATSPELIQRVWRQAAPCAWSHPDGSATESLTHPVRGLISGSFNPLHAGHRHLKAVSEELLGGAVCFELTVSNADKPPLDFLSIEERRKQFHDGPLAITAAALFREKARLFPGATFVIGFDTAERVIDPRFYGHSESGLEAALDEVAAHGCSFLVAGRVAAGHFRTLDELAVPPKYAALFREIPESAFREDISSTELRRGRRAGGLD